MHTRVGDRLADAPASAGAALTIILAFAAALAYAGVFLHSGAEHTLLGLVCLASVLICIVPLWIRRECDLFGPMVYILVLTIIAMPLRHLYLMLAAPNQEEFARLTNGEPIAFFIPAAIMVNVALAGLVGGYLCTTYRFKVERISLARSTSWRTHWHWPVIMLVIAVSAAAFIKYVSLTGFEFQGDVALLSKKRSFSGDFAGGYLVWATGLAKYAFFIALAYLMSRHRRLPPSAAPALLTIAAVALVPPFFSSSRTGVLEVAVVGVAIYIYMGGRVNLLRATLILVPVLGIVSVITMFRAQGAAWTGWADVFDPTNLVGAVAASWNYGGFVATAHVMNTFGLEDYTLGSTLTFWTYAWIPRSVWPDKPLEVGYMLLEIFDFRGDLPTRRGGGAAAGLPAELYLSFGPLLVPLGMFIFGAFTRIVYNSLRPLAHSSPVAAVFCATLSFAFAHGYGYGLSRGMLQVGKDAVVLGLIFLVLLRSKRNINYL